MKKILAVLSIVVLASALFTFAVKAEDEVVPGSAGEWGFCTHKNAVNYIGADVIRDFKEMGFKVVDDGSCYYLQCDPVYYEDIDGSQQIGGYSCDEGTENHQNFDDWVNDRLPGMSEYGPAYYGKLIDTVGCLDPEADNYMDPQWWPDYNIYNGGCEYGNAPEGNDPGDSETVSWSD